MKSFTLLLVVIGLFLIMSISVAQAQDGLVAFWALDEETGNTIIDSSPNGLNGTANGTSIIDGVKGKARSFNGSTDFLEVPDNNLLDINGEITIMLWVKTDQAFVSRNAFPISKRVTDGEINYTVVLGQIGGNSVIGFEFGASPGVIYYAEANFHDNQWHHFAISFQFGNPASARWVMDGNLVSGTWYQGDGSQVPNTNAANLQIGRQLSTSPCYYKGALDQIRIYNDALDETQIHAIYDEEKPQPPPPLADLGLLVKNSASLDAEEQAAYDFASTHGLTVTKIDPASILATPDILNTVDGFWAANNSAPTGFDDPTISTALKAQLEGGKGLLITWYGNYMAQYLGLGTASLGSSWNPVVSDHEYWVDEIDDHAVFENLFPWIPPSGPPDDDSKLLFYVTPGYIPIGNIRVNWSVPYTRYRFAHIWASYGWCGQSFDPALQAQYGISGTCQRSVQVSSILEAEVGTGSVILGPCSMAGGDHWHWGEMGFQMVENMLTYLCSGGQPPPTIETQLVMTPVNPIVRTGEAQNFQVTLTDNEGNPVPWKTINFTWEYSGLEPIENFNGSGTRQTDVLGQCNLNWFSKWAAFDGNVTVTLTASFAGDGEYITSSFSTSIMVDATPAQIFARVFKDLNGNGTYEHIIDQLIPNLPLTISSAYNNYTRIATSTTGEYNIFLPKCAYNLFVTVLAYGVEHPITKYLNISDFVGPDNVASVEFAYRPRTATIRGVVLWNSYTNEYVRGATVRLYRSSGGGAIATTTTNDLGEFTFDVISEQNYIVHVTGEYDGQRINRFEEVSIGDDVEVSLVISLDLVDWLTVYLYADHCLDSWAEISDQHCLYDAAMAIIGVMPVGCAVPFAEDLCNFVDNFEHALLPGNPGGWNAVIESANDMVLDALGCLLNLEAVEFIADFPAFIEALGSCLNTVLSQHGASLHNKNAIAHTLIVKSSEGMAASAVLTNSPVWMDIVDAYGQHVTLGMNDSLINDIGVEVGLFRDQWRHELAILLNSSEAYTITLRCYPDLNSDTTFGLIVLVPNFDETYTLIEYVNVPITNVGLAVCALPPSGETLPLLFDSDGDGQFDKTVEPTSVVVVTGYSSLSGSVVQGGMGLLGVSLDIYNSTGDLWQSVVTDDSGYFYTDSIPNGHYTATVVTPLGYQADQETKEFTVHHVPVTVDFNLTKLEIVPLQRSMGYWKHQVNVYLSGRGEAQETLADMSSYMGLIREHFNNNLANLITVFQVPQPATQIDSLEALRDLLTVSQDGTMSDRAKQQLIALMLNVVSLKLHQATPISEDSATVSQAITYCSELITDSDPSNDEVAKDIADCINNGILVQSGVIPLSTPNIAYKGTGEQVTQTSGLPQTFSLEQNYPNPFNPDCEIRYALPADAEVNLSVYNMLGQKVTTLVEEYQTAGHKTVHWNGTDENGNKVASGIYFYRIKAGDYTESKKMILMK